MARVLFGGNFCRGVRGTFSVNNRIRFNASRRSDAVKIHADGSDAVDKSDTGNTGEKSISINERESSEGVEEERETKRRLYAVLPVDGAIQLVLDNYVSFLKEPSGKVKKARNQAEFLASRSDRAIRSRLPHKSSRNSPARDRGGFAFVLVLVVFVSFAGGVERDLGRIETSRVEYRLGWCR